MSSLPVLIEADPAAASASATILFSRERQAAFLAALADTGQVRCASARAGVSHQTAYRMRRSSPGFRRAWDAALLAARVQAEEMLACRAIEGWEEDVVYHGEVVATRHRWSDRLLLAHLARLDRLCGDAEVAGFADMFDDHLARYAAGEDRPARCVPAEGGPRHVTRDTTSGGDAGGPEAPAFAGDQEDGNSSSGQWSRRSTPADPEPEHEPCPDCGGQCLDPAAALTCADCQWLGNRLARMEAARPAGVPRPHRFYDAGSVDAIEAAQLAAFEAEVADWWWVVPPPEGGDPARWHYLAEEDR